MLKWYYLFFTMGLSLHGPYDTQEECLKALESDSSSYTYANDFSPPFHPGGICIQGAPYPPMTKD